MLDLPQKSGNGVVCDLKKGIIKMLKNLALGSFSLERCHVLSHKLRPRSLT
jgi:hypothetical protein